MLLSNSITSDFHLVLNPDAELAEDALSIGLSSLQEDSEHRSGQPQGSEGGWRPGVPLQTLSLPVSAACCAPLPRASSDVCFAGDLHRYEMRDLCSGAEEADILLASGCFMLVRTAALQSIGGFDDRYFLYFEDFDLSIRLGSQGRLVFSPAIHITHHGGYAASKGFRHVKYFIRSGITFFREHGWRWV